MSDFLDKLHSGKLYLPQDPRIDALQRDCLELQYDFNQTRPHDLALRQELLAKMFHKLGKNCYVEPPIHANWGGHFISLGDNVYINFNFTAVDDTYIEIGDNVMIGPNVTIATANHPENLNDRAQGKQYNQKVILEKNVWVGAGAIILPGVTIGEGSIIGAGSVVTHDITKGVIAVGNPCKVLRKLKDDSYLNS